MEITVADDISAEYRGLVQSILEELKEEARRFIP